jgi:hypothetical protein
MENKKLTLGYWLSIIGIVLGVLSIGMMFLPAMKTDVKSTDLNVGLYNTFELTFGKSEKGVEIMGFSFLNFMTILIIGLGVVMLILSALKVRVFGKKSEIVLPAVASLLLIVGGILATFAIEFAVLVGSKWVLLSNSLREAPILTGIIAIVSGGCAFAPIIISKKA